MVMQPSPDDNLDMAQLLGEDESQYHSLHRGEVVDGVIMKVDKDGLLVNVGQKTEGVVPSREMRSLAPEAADALKVGDTIMVAVVRPETDEGQALLSLDRAQGERAWRRLQEFADEEAVIEAEVVDHNKGGAIVSVEGVQGFVPLSQLSNVSRPPGDGEENSGLAALVGSALKLKVIEVNRRRNRAILSEKAALQEFRQEQKERLLEELLEGETRPGRVSGITNFGVFVDLGGADGLIHISELAWNPVGSPEEVVKVGDELDVYVIKVDRVAKRIALSLKRTQPEPWAAIGDKYEIGSIVPATITRLTTFGAFARVESAIEGLIHISELTDRMIGHPKEAVREGDQVKVKILKVDVERRRMGLSLKQVEDAVEEQAAVSYGQGDSEYRIERPALNMEMAAELNRAFAETEQSEPAEAAPSEAELPEVEVAAELGESAEQEAEAEPEIEPETEPGTEQEVEEPASAELEVEVDDAPADGEVPVSSDDTEPAELDEETSKPEEELTRAEQSTD